jgi:inner membrane protein
LILRRTNPRGHWLNGAGLALSTLYLVWSIGAKLHVNTVVEAELARASFPHNSFLTIPTPFNTLLWRVLVMTPTGYAEGYYSLLDRTRPLEFTRYPSQPELLAGLEDAWTVRRLQWFTHGFYAVSREGDAVVMTDLRMGLEPDYFFRFQVGAVHNPYVVPVESRRLLAERRLDRLGELWARLRGAPVAAGPAKVPVEPLRGG